MEARASEDQLNQAALGLPEPSHLEKVSLTISLLKESRQQKVQALGGNKNIPAARFNDLAKLENIEALQEFKQASSMLSPLKQREGSIPKNQSSKNPLVPLKHFIKN